ncbi:hypothetical protein [Arenimonas metalli]|uniref:hypothetical protein n=1 Tax=Arenimonas metalli TaxID=948077 RepID=UPI001B803E4D|nr:hypothetical protein [Arenimonas metalli]
MVLVVACLPLCAQADMFAPSHSCRKPIKPYEFTSEWEVSQFKDDVERYKQCISDFVEEQNDEAEKHQEAAQDAIDEWNRYVRYELE